MGRSESTSVYASNFESLECTGVAKSDDAEALGADFRLEGPLEAWQAMFDDIAANGRATGPLHDQQPGPDGRSHPL